MRSYSVGQWRQTEDSPRWGQDAGFGGNCQSDCSQHALGQMRKHRSMTGLGRNMHGGGARMRGSCSSLPPLVTDTSGGQTSRPRREKPPCVQVHQQPQLRQVPLAPESPNGRPTWQPKGGLVVRDVFHVRLQPLDSAAPCLPVAPAYPPTGALPPFSPLSRTPSAVHTPTARLSRADSPRTTPQSVTSASSYGSYSSSASSKFPSSHASPSARPPRPRPLRRSNSFSPEAMEAAAMVQSASADSISTMPDHGIVPPLPTTAPAAGQETKVMLAEIASMFEMRCDDSGEIHRDSLPRALALLGFTDTKQCWVDEILLELTQFSALNSAEFESFVLDYEARRERGDMDIFRKLDTLNAGPARAAELSALLSTSGFTAMSHVIEQMVDEVCKKGQGVCSSEEFRMVLHLVRTREGFSREDVGRFSNVFQKFAQGSPLSLPPDRLVSVLGYLDFHLQPEEILSIGKEVDVDGSGDLSEREFLVCMRKVRELELDRVRTFLGGRDAKNRLCSTRLAELVHMLGYTPEPAALRDAAEATGLGDPALGSSLTFVQVWRIVEKIRSFEGFTRKEAVEVSAVFKQFAASTGMIESHDVGKALRLLGLLTPYNVLGQLVAGVDIEGAGSLDAAKFTKLVRKHHEWWIGAVRRSFAVATIEADQLGGSTPSIAPTQGIGPEERWKNALCGAQQAKTRTRSALGRLTALAGADSSGVHKVMEARPDRVSGGFLDFLEAAGELRSLGRQAVISHHGFGLVEVEELRARFEELGGSRGGLIGRQVHVIIDHMFSDLRASAANAGGRPHLVSLLAEADKDKGRAVDFDGLLGVLRRCTDIWERWRILRDREAVTEAGFSAREVEDFREVFLGEDVRETLSLPEVRDMLSPVVPMGHHNSLLIAAEFQDIVTKTGGELAADFPDFLLLVRRLMERNVGNINEHSLSICFPRSPTG